MDQLTRDLLQRWGCENYLTQFSDGRVDSGTLRILSDDEISQLIPIPGDRARFKVNLRNWKQELADLSCREPELDSLSFIHDTSLNLGTVLRNTEFILESPVNESSSKKELLNLDSTNCYIETDNQCRERCQRPLEIQNYNIEGIPAKTYEYISQQTSTDSNTSDGTVQCGYVLKTLQTTIDGRAILKNKPIQKLDESQRNILVKLLIQPIFEKNPNAQISNKQLLSWSLEIQDIFPRESAALYYTPYISALVQTTARNASGKLLRYVYNKRQQLRNRGIIERARSRSSTSTSSTSSNPEVAPLIRLPAASAESDESIVEKLAWLRNSLEPWHLIEENWAATAAFRLKKNYLAGGSLHEYFTEYPVLKSPTGYRLLLNDFNVMYADKVDSLYTRLPELSEKIIEIAKIKLENNIRDNDIKQTIQGYLHLIIDANRPEIKNNAALMLLPYITSSTPLKEKRKTLWRPSKAEVRDGFVTQIAADSELETTIANRKIKLERFGKTLQPFIIFVGPSVAEITCCYVVVADTFYKINKLITAIDACFKIIQATGAQYQSEAYVVWMVIQKAFYGIATPYDKDLTTVKSLLIDLGV